MLLTRLVWCLSVKTKSSHASVRIITCQIWTWYHIQVTTVLVILKIWENNGTEKIGFVIPPWGQGRFTIQHRDVWLGCSLQWRHNGRDSFSNHQHHDCLLNGLFRRWLKKTWKLCVTGLCARNAGNSPGTGEFPAQMASNAENVSTWWRHHA